jgi:hypothetical protein
MADCAARRGRGAAKGNTHALKTGEHTHEARNFRKGVQAQIAQAHALVAFAQAIGSPCARQAEVSGALSLLARLVSGSG